MGLIICGGRAIECDAPVTTWRYRSKLSFPRLRMRTETRAVIWHHTAGVGLAEQVHRTLTERGLSVHFLCEPDGAIFQFCDAQTRAMHAREANAWAVGVEVVNLANDKPAKGRALLRESIHGIETVATSFTPAQVRSCLALAAALEHAYDLPSSVPMNGRDVASTVMPPDQLATYRGHLPHSALTTAKRDCNLAFLRALAARPNHGTLRPDGPAQ